MAITSHGYHIPGSVYKETEKYVNRARCGGVTICSICMGDVGRWREQEATETNKKNEPGDPAREYFEEGTMSVVFNAMVGSGLSRDQALDAMREMQNAGILFRQRLPEFVGQDCNEPNCRAGYYHVHSYACNASCTICHGMYDNSQTH